jgi:hypothetical protein
MVVSTKRCKKSHNFALKSKTLPQSTPLASTKPHISKLESETKTLPIFLFGTLFFRAGGSSPAVHTRLQDTMGFCAAHASYLLLRYQHGTRVVFALCSFFYAHSVLVNDLPSNVRDKLLDGPN